MRYSISFIGAALLAVAVIPAHADELTFTLVSNNGSNPYIGYGQPTNLPPDPDSCLPPNCVLFTGLLTDNDVDPSPDISPSYLGISNPYTGPPPYDGTGDQVAFAGFLKLDNTAPTIQLLSGDTNYATDGSGNPPNSYLGPVFGVDIPVGTPAGAYVDAVNLDITPTNGNSPFTEFVQVTVIVGPEPAPAGLALAGLAALGALGWFKRRASH